MDQNKERIRWSPRIRPELIKRLYESDALGLQDSVANNLIEGDHDQVVEFLDRLTGVDPGRKEQWRETMQQMMRRRKGK